MQAAGADIAGTPMRLTREVHIFGQVPHLPSGPSLDPNQWNAWLQTAARIESAHRTTIAWLRSRMPGYPQLPAPQLAPGTASTTTEWTRRLTWQPGERAAGLQMKNLPPHATRPLRATSSQVRALEESARALATALQASQPWQQLSAARQALDEESRKELRQTRARLREGLSDAAINAHEANRVLLRHNYRCTVLDEEIEKLTGPARQFANAFDAADQLVELAASDVFGQLALYGSPLLLQNVTDIDLEPGTPQNIHFSVHNDYWLNTGELIQIDDPLAADTCRLIATTVSFGPDSDAAPATRLTAQTLPGTASLWQATPPS
ncbi:hypothetical protein [Streptomyces sp. WMMC1477]|uniref:hypothetical protein n=1 Tax=Streptomyces sp. WMMC1477 TaxID=3015155 RepID=UPI0022B66BE5|nr:hypothetical protein [Streptomyces sp. WMMC1477]MCZ7434762.1 hypothetical protein [Streptomyces sp. WMMC1477]